eukprot:7506109-Pyramimonas_sp.AAC.1
MRAAPLGPSLKSPANPAKLSRGTEMDNEDACGQRHWGLRWKFIWGLETCERRAGMGGGGACGRRHLGFRWGSL